MIEQNNKKSNKTLIIIFVVALVILMIFTGNYLFNIFQKAPENTGSANAPISEFNNIESEIYQANSNNQLEKTHDSSINQTEVLLKQQLQISELQHNLSELKSEIERIKTGDALSKIILSFVKIQDLVEKKQNYYEELQKLELLCRADFALSRKIEKLRSSLSNSAKNNIELSKEFFEISPILKAKKVELDSHGSWSGKIKAFFTKYIVIKKTGEKSKSDFDRLVDNLQISIDNKQYTVAIQVIDNMDPQYQEILVNLKTDLQNADDFKQISNEIYRYLEMLSN